MHRTLLALCSFALALPTACRHLPFTGSGDDAGSEVAAVFQGEEITVAEVDAYAKERLFDAATKDGNATKLYELRSQNLDRMLTERVLAAEAERRGITQEALLEGAVEKGGAVTEAEVESFYRENPGQMGGMRLEQAAPLIRRYLEQRRHVDLIARLRDEADVEVLLEQPRVEVAAVGPARGPEDAPVTIVEFSDFQCPFCERAAPVVSQIAEHYGDRVRIVYRHLPLDAIHPRARAAAEASACAAEQGRFWEYHDALFANRSALSDDALEAHARELGLDVDAFAACYGEGRFRKVVEADAAAARALGITGTPAFVVNGIVLTGAQSFRGFAEVIESELARVGAEGPGDEGGDDDEAS